MDAATLLDLICCKAISIALFPPINFGCEVLMQSIYNTEMETILRKHGNVHRQIHQHEKGLAKKTHALRMSWNIQIHGHNSNLCHQSNDGMQNVRYIIMKQASKGVSTCSVFIKSIIIPSIHVGKDNCAYLKEQIRVL